MQEQNNKLLVEKYWLEVWNNKKIELLDDIFEENYIVDNPPPWRKAGRDGLKQFILDNFRMFPDVRNEIEDIIAKDSKVVSRVTARATHSGDLMGPVGLVPATNKRISWRGIHIFEFKDKKVIKTWSIVDNIDLMQQLGAIQKPD
jgi:steroid delta-isomerase-like uncharacterized protein